jgi:hypothetical protein
MNKNLITCSTKIVDEQYNILNGVRSINSTIQILIKNIGQQNILPVKLQFELTLDSEVIIKYNEDISENSLWLQTKEELELQSHFNVLEKIKSFDAYLLYKQIENEQIFSQKILGTDYYLTNAIV